MRDLARFSGFITGIGVGIAPHILLILVAFSISDAGTAVVVLCCICLTPFVSLILPGLFYSFVYSRFHSLPERRGAIGGALSSSVAQLIAGLIWFVVIAIFHSYLMDTVIGEEILGPWSRDEVYRNEYQNFFGGVYMSIIVLTLVMALFGSILSAFSGSLGARLFSRAEKEDR